MKLRTLEIDWDIHKMIEGERRGFDEAPYLALRRLLGLNEPPVELPTTVPCSPVSEGMPWIEDGVQIPHGSLARMKYYYGRQTYEGRFLNGQLVVNGSRYDALSPAANDLAITKGGKKTQLNGWNYWEVQLPGENAWVRLRDLRSKALKELAQNLQISI